MPKKLLNPMDPRVKDAIVDAALAWGTAMSVHYIEPSPDSDELDDIRDAAADLRELVMPYAPRLTKSKTWKQCGPPTKKRLKELREEWDVSEKVPTYSWDIKR